MTDQRIAYLKMYLSLWFVSRKIKWQHKRANVRMRRQWEGGHRIQENTYYGYTARSIVLRLRSERPIFGRMHDGTETLVML